MDTKWVLERDFDAILAGIKEFECPEIALEIKPIMVRSDRALFGCYIPAMPRMTIVISGKVWVTKLGEGLTEIQTTELKPWVEPFIKTLIEHIQ